MPSEARADGGDQFSIPRSRPELVDVTVLRAEAAGRLVRLILGRAEIKGASEMSGV